MRNLHADPFLLPQKQVLRQALRAQRVALAARADLAAARTAGEAVAAHLDGAVVWPSGACVAVYASALGELDAEPIAQRARQKGQRICYPRVVRSQAQARALNDSAPELTFHLVASTAELQQGTYGLLEPAQTAPPAPPIDVFVVPGLGFDARGHRLGQGHGYYDAALHAQPGALRIGIGYDWQILPDLPSEPHDEPMDLVVTPTGVLLTRARPAHPFCAISSSICKEEPS